MIDHGAVHRSAQFGRGAVREIGWKLVHDSVEFGAGASLEACLKQRAVFVIASRYELIREPAVLAKKERQHDSRDNGAKRHSVK